MPILTVFWANAAAGASAAAASAQAMTFFTGLISSPRWRQFMVQ
jgi:hypothetical protein